MISRLVLGFFLIAASPRCALCGQGPGLFGWRFPRMAGGLSPAAWMERPRSGKRPHRNKSPTGRRKKKPPPLRSLNRAQTAECRIRGTVTRSISWARLRIFPWGASAVSSGGMKSDLTFDPRPSAPSPTPETSPEGGFHLRPRGRHEVHSGLRSGQVPRTAVGCRSQV